MWAMPQARLLQAEPAITVRIGAGLTLVWISGPPVTVVPIFLVSKARGRTGLTTLQWPWAGIRQAGTVLDKATVRLVDPR